MKLLINTIIYNNTYPPLYEAFLQSFVSTIIQNYEDSNIIMLCEAKYNNIIDNGKIDIITIPLKQPLFKKAIYKKHVQTILKKEKPDIIWHVDLDMVSFYTIPSHFLWHNYSTIAAKKIHQILNAANKLTIHTNNEKIQQQFLHNEKIKYWLPLPHKNFKALSWKDKMEVCETYTQGYTYFHLCADELTETAIIACLKAFSIFKQWQQSQMKLIITVKHIPYKLSILLETYKFKQDVLLLPYHSINELATIAAASYITLYTALTDFSAWFTTSCATAKILTITDSTIALHQNAVFTCIWNNAELSKAMLMLYKDEQLQKNIHAVQDVLLLSLKKK